MNVAEIIVSQSPMKYVPLLFGQGGGGNQCRYCGAVEWKEIEHKSTCLWLLAMAEVGE